MANLVPIDHPWVDESRAPMYLYALPKDLTDDALRAFCAARERWAKIAKYPVVWVVDLQNLGGASALQRKIFAEHLARFEYHDIAYTRGVAIVAPNTIVRGIVTAVFWLKTPQFSHKTFSARPEAVKWALAQLQSAPR
jgi:hypothetical protein